VPCAELDSVLIQYLLLDPEINSGSKRNQKGGGIIRTEKNGFNPFLSP